MALSAKKMVTKYKANISAKLGVSPSTFNDPVLECLFQTIIDSIKEDLESIGSDFPGTELIASGSPVEGVITIGKIPKGNFR